jgi:hypothetical protein
MDCQRFQRGAIVQNPRHHATDPGQADDVRYAYGYNDVGQVKSVDIAYSFTELNKGRY